MPRKLWAALKRHLLTAISTLNLVKTAASQGLGWWQELRLQEQLIRIGDALGDK